MQTDTTPSPLDVTGDFTSDGVDDFGSAGAFTGTLPGEQPPQSAPTGAGSDLDAALAGVNFKDLTEDLNDGKKVDAQFNVIGVKVWKDAKVAGRVALIFDLEPTSPPVCAAAGKQPVFCDIAGPNVADVAKGVGKLRALAAACGTPLAKEGSKLENGQSVGTLVGKSPNGKMSKGKKAGQFFLDF